MKTVLAPKSIALSIKRVMSTKLNLSAAIGSRPMLQCQKGKPCAGGSAGFHLSTFHLSTGFSGRGTRRTAGLAF